jgi:hypothetical protein
MAPGDAARAALVMAIVAQHAHEGLYYQMWPFIRVVGLGARCHESAGSDAGGRSRLNVRPPANGRLDFFQRRKSIFCTYTLYGMQ